MRELYGPEFFDSGYYQNLRTRIAECAPTRGLEIGFAWGMSTVAFLEVTDAPLITIDLDDQMEKEEMVKRTFGDRWTFLKGDSSTLLKTLEGTFDWIYIDGDHSYEGVKRDLIAAIPLLADDGRIVCDDYGNPCGVKQAVDEFAEQHKLTISPLEHHPNGAVVLCRT